MKYYNTISLVATDNMERYFCTNIILVLRYNQFGCYKLYQRFKIKKVQVGKDQEKAQSEKDSHSKNRGGTSVKNRSSNIIITYNQFGC